MTTIVLTLALIALAIAARLAYDGWQAWIAVRAERRAAGLEANRLGLGWRG